jgi:hypothetical protein
MATYYDLAYTRKYLETENIVRNYKKMSCFVLFETLLAAEIRSRGSFRISGTGAERLI